jgi:hypothetical protein
MAAEIVAHAGADRVRHAVEIAEHLDQRLLADHRGILGKIVHVGNVGGVMPVVMDLHRLGIDMRFKRRDRIGQRRQDEWRIAGSRGGRRSRLGESKTGRDGRGSDAGRSEHEMASGHR